MRSPLPCFLNVGNGRSRTVHNAAHKLGIKHGNPGYKPTVTYVVAGKRHHIRFFPEPGNSDRSGNCHAGTVIDTKVRRSPLPPH